jgi:hypothetical protein
MKPELEGNAAERRWANARLAGQSPEPKENQGNLGKHDHRKSSFEGNIDVLEDHSPERFPPILVKHSDWGVDDLRSPILRVHASESGQWTVGCPLM